MTADIIIYGGFLITMEGKGTGVIPNGALAIKGNQIAAVGTTDDITAPLIFSTLCISSTLFRRTAYSRDVAV